MKSVDITLGGLYEGKPGEHARLVVELYPSENRLSYYPVIPNQRSIAPGYLGLVTVYGQSITGFARWAKKRRPCD